MVSIELTLVGIGPIAEEVAVSITDGITLLYGPNGAGKSTIMRALANVIYILMGYGVQVRELMEMVNKERRLGEVGIKIDGPRYSISIDINNKEIVVRRDNEELTRTKVTEPAGIAPIQGVLPRKYPILWVKPMGVVKVLGLDAIEPQNVSFRDLLLPSTVEKALSSRLIIGSEVAKVYREYLDAINTALNYVVNYDLKIIGDAPYFVDLSRNSTHYITYEYVADGVKQALAIVTVAEFAELLRKHLDAAPVLLIDDVETALHYDYLISLLQYLAKRQYPVILETHNGLALRYAYNNKLRFYVVEDGKAFTDIKSSALFKKEVVAYGV